MRRGRAVVAGTVVAMLSGIATGVASATPTSWAARVAISPHGLDAVACPTASLCLAVGSNGIAVSSTHPAGGAAAWTSADIDGAHRLVSVSCPSVAFCAASDNASAVLTSANPTGGASAWVAHTIDPGRWITAISCTSAHFCAAVDRHGGVLTSTHPTDPHRSWARIQVPHTSFVAISCPTMKLCIAANNARGVLVSTNPTGGTHAWRGRTVLPADTVLLGVSCASVHACMLVNYENGTDVAFRPSTHPTAAGIWRPDGDVTGYPHEGTARGAVSCVNGSFCAGITFSDSDSGDGWYTADFGRHWHHDGLAASLGGDHKLAAISCGSTSLCVAVDDGGGALVGS